MRPLVLCYFGQEERLAGERGERAAQQQVDEQGVAAARHGGGQPEAAAHGERAGRPHHAPAHAHPELVGLHLPRLHVGDHPIVQERGVRPRLVQLGAHGVLVQPEGRHDRRDGAAVEE